MHPIIPLNSLFPASISPRKPPPIILPESHPADGPPRYNPNEHDSPHARNDASDGEDQNPGARKHERDVGDNADGRDGCHGVGLIAEKADDEGRFKGGEGAIRGRIGDGKGDDWDEDGLECGPGRRRISSICSHGSGAKLTSLDLHSAAPDLSVPQRRSSAPLPDPVHASLKILSSTAAMMAATHALRHWAWPPGR